MISKWGICGHIMGETKRPRQVSPQDKAESLLRTGKIRVGINSCTVVERVNVTQCFRCWGYGHYRKECKEEDRSINCRKCGRIGHKAEECGEELCCLTCKRTGHAAGSGACPEFRKALAWVRAKAKAKRRY
ncbi:zinc finger protein GIS2-like [Anoplophora glabripennis]|uniref:zinc finger protein GIS2-like n=1 Tax=Anoplophora glabripennis TaxID=217634 RepID=UPI0008748362|nr:zinc finger protein GIS2-like [Anoplophora glabripennis]